MPPVQEAYIHYIYSTYSTHTYIYILTHPKDLLGLSEERGKGRERGGSPRGGHPCSTASPS